MGAERAARGRGRGGIAQDTYRPELCFSRRSELRQCRDEQCTWGCAHLVPGLLQCRHSDLFWCGIDAGGHRFAVPMQQWQKGRKSRKNVKFSSQIWSVWGTWMHSRVTSMYAVPRRSICGCILALLLRHHWKLRGISASFAAHLIRNFYVYGDDALSRG